MRRQWYLGFGIILLLCLLGLVMIHHDLWMLVILIPLVFLWIYDKTQTQHSLLRNFPVLGHIRFIFEFIRPEIQQYFIADDLSEKPYNRETRTIIYQRAKNVRDTVPFGTEHDVRAVGYEWILHSLKPLKPSEVEPRILIGGPNCLKPYSASRFNISGMSHGALSPTALKALNGGAKLGGFYHNTGEGGLSEYHLSEGADVVFQIGTGYFGCRDDHGNFDPEEFQKEATRESVKMIELKLSQGAKPSHGGILPAAKLTPEIAKIRKVKLGEDVVSPAAHSAFSNPEGLLHFIQTLRELSGGKPVGFKLCVGKKTEFFAICKAMLSTGILPDFITVDGGEGGTGAAPLEFVNHMGTPLDEGLNFVHNALVGIDVRNKIKIICSGKVATGFDMLTKIAMGADMCNAARAFMISMGCIQSKQCHANTCPTGVATQDPRLMKGLISTEKRHRVAHFHASTMHSFLELIAGMGLANPSDLQPIHIKRRVAVDQIKTYAEIYEYFETGCLLDPAKIPANYLRYWQMADAKMF